MKRETRLSAIATRLFYGETDKKIRSELGVPESTYFYWKRRIQEEGLANVIKRKRPGPAPSAEIASDLARKIISWRNSFGWGPTKIEGHLKAHCSLSVSHRQVHKLLVKKGLNKPIPAPRKTWGKGRFERNHSLSLLHADWKDIGSGPMLTFLDDHSRFVLGSRIFENATTDNAIGLLREVVDDFGVPEQVITDHGTQFWNNRGEKPSKFSSICKELKVEHILCTKKHPQANGKLESFHGCYDNEAWRFKTHPGFIRYWNYKRPHGGIGYLFPAEVFFKDLP